MTHFQAFTKSFASACCRNYHVQTILPHIKASASSHSVAALSAAVPPLQTISEQSRSTTCPAQQTYDGKAPHPHQVFINHRGPDTRRNISGLLYDNLLRLGYRPFLGYRNMKAGEKLPEMINTAIRDCKVGVAVFSPKYCESLYCLDELALLMEYKKRVVPIFYNVKPSRLRVGDIYNGTGRRVSEKDLERFSRALEEAKNIVGLHFDSSRGYWSEFIRSASDAIIEQIDKNDT